MTTTTTTTPMSATRRLLSIGAATAIAAVGLVALSAPAHAADASSKVWVCKYVGKPGDDEVLKEGKNPIEVSGNSVDKAKDGQVFVGDQFADAQGRSVVVQIGGEDPGCRHLLDDSPAGHPADDRSDARPTGGRRRATSHRIQGGEGRRRPRRPGRGRWHARRGRPRGGRGGAASPGCHPSVTSTRAGGPPKGRPAHPSVTGRVRAAHPGSPRIPVGDVDACERPPKGRPAPQGADRPSGPARVRNAPK